MKEYAEKFYKSKAWQQTRNAYAASKKGLCEICLAKGIYKPGVIVHHKRHLNPETIKNPYIALSWNNLQLVCRECHAEIHAGTHRNGMRYYFAENGDVITL